MAGPLGLLPACLMLLVSCAPTDQPQAPASAPDAEPRHNTLTAEEQADGWQLLFDGSSFSGWRGLGREEVPAGHWVIEEGTIRKVASGAVPTAADGQPLEGGDLMTVETYGNFELRFEWRISEAGNSGIKYNVSEDMSTASPPLHAALGFEYQVLDDDGHPDAANGPTRMAAALYDMIPAPNDKPLHPVGEYNASRIVFNGNHGEHWLNGQKILAYDLGTSEFNTLLAASKYRDIDGFADRRQGHIVLQDHSDDVWYRNIKIRMMD